MSNKNFQELLAALSTAEDDSANLAKSVAAEPATTELEDEPDDDATIAAAAGAAAPDAPGGDEADETLGKSMSVTGEDGQAFEAFDATEFIKSMGARQATTDETLAKALQSFASVTAKQNEMIKSLSDQVRSLSAQGRGRKAVLSVVDKPEAGGQLAKSQEAANPGMTPDVFFAKANTAFDEGKISGKELNVISVCLRSNHPIEQQLVSKVIA